MGKDGLPLDSSILFSRRSVVCGATFCSSVQNAPVRTRPQAFKPKVVPDLVQTERVLNEWPLDPSSGNKGPKSFYGIETPTPRIAIARLQNIQQNT